MMDELIERFEEYLERTVFPEELDEAMIYKVSNPRGSGTDVWSDTTKKYLLEFIEKGASMRKVSEKTSEPNKVPDATIKLWAREHMDEDERINAKKQLLFEWYTQLTSPKKSVTSVSDKSAKIITLDDYWNTYQKSGIEAELYSIGDSLKLLYDTGRIFPYIPTADDAYVVGVLFASGTIMKQKAKSGKARSFTFLVNAPDTIVGLDVIEKLKRKNKKYGSGLGRLYHLLGMPIGSKSKQTFPVPEWIFSDREYRRHFLAGFMDAKAEFVENRSQFKIRISKNANAVGNLGRFGMFCYIDQLQRLMDEEEILVTPASSYIWSHIAGSPGGDYKKLTGRTEISFQKDNLQKVLELPMRNETLKTQLSQYVGRS